MLFRSLEKSLLEARTLLLSGPVTDRMLRDATVRCLAMEQTDAKKPITVLINSPGGSADAGEEGELGKHPETGEPIMRKAGRFGPYIQMGDGKEAARSSIPKDIGELDLDLALRLLHLPRTIGAHPETGLPIKIGRAHV